MKGIIYKLRVYASVLDWNHDAGREITEIYIPEVKIVANEEAIFQILDQDRYEHAQKIKEIELPDDEVDELLRFVEKKSNAENIVKEWLNRNEKS